MMSWDHLLTWLFPPRCTHCKAPLDSVKPLFCGACAEQFVPESIGDCRAKNIVEGVSFSGVFSFDSPGASLTKRFVSEKDPRLAKLLAEHLVAQKEKLLWPDPDALLALPKTAGAPLLTATLKKRFRLKKTERSGNVYIISPWEPDKAHVDRFAEKIARALPKRLFFLSLLKKPEHKKFAARG